ncbi:MAG: Flp family type IVb pilin [Pseudomonadales bacterium]
MTIRQKMIDFLKEEEGLTAVEYAIAGGLVSAALVAGFVAVGEDACAMMLSLVTAISTGTGSGNTITC